MKTRASSCKPSKAARAVARGLVRGTALGIAAAMVTSPAQAAFHLWNIREIYTDASGSLQFIEFFTASSGQEFVMNQQVRVSNVGNTVTHTLTLPGNLPSGTANHAFLIGTAGLQAAGGPTPNYIMSDNFLFSAGGTINFFGANSGIYTALATDGVLSRTWGDGNAVNSPQNFAGQVGTVVVPEPSTWGLVGLGGIGLCFLLRRRAA